MNKVNEILNDFLSSSPYGGLQSLWGCCIEAYANIDNVFENKCDINDVFFEVLLSLLASGNYCLFFNLNYEDQSYSTKHLTCTPHEQIEILRKVWIGREEMDKMDEENDYVDWWFLVYCPYSLASKLYDENGNFIKWLLAE